MILVIDNYDSFVYNLARHLQRLGVETRVLRNDAVTASDVARLAPQAIVISPGPCTPDEAGSSVALAAEFYQTIPLLGVCLGHQAIAQALGARVVRDTRPWHGQASSLTHTATGIFAGLPPTMKVGRYHSLVVQPESLPAELTPTAWTEDRTLMAFEHRELPVVGVQFHPESILTEHGYVMLANFLQIAGITPSQDPVQLASSEYTKPSVASYVPERPVTF